MQIVLPTYTHYKFRLFFKKKVLLRKFTVAVYVIYIYGRDVCHWCQL